MERLQRLQSKLFFAKVGSRLKGKRVSAAACSVLEALRTARDDDNLYDFLVEKTPEKLACSCNSCHSRVVAKSAVQVKCKCLLQIMHPRCAKKYSEEYKTRCAMCLGKIHTTEALPIYKE